MARKDAPKYIRDLNPERFVVIDTDTGQVLTLNVRIVKWPHLIKTQQSLITDNEFAREYALEYGEPLLVRTLFDET